MKTWITCTGIALGALALAGAAAILIGKELGERKMQRVIQLTPAPLKPSTPAPRLAQGRYLFATRGCADCHGADGGGREVIRSGAMLVISPNITQGPNSSTADYLGQDWVRTLRHGIKPDGRPVMIMPSEDYNRLTDDDLAAVVAWVRQLPPVAGQKGVVQLPLAVKLMYGIGMVRDAAEMIDHARPPEQPVPAAVTVAHGAYVAHSCAGCHGEHLSGGRIPGSPAEWPPTANLTPGSGSAMARYPTPESFMAMLKTGVRPDGTPVSGVMPFGSLSQMSEVDMRALHKYLQTLPPRPAGGR